MTTADTVMPWNCPRHGWWQRQPGSGLWNDAQVSRRGGGAQHRCDTCDGWIYCTDWAACPDELPLAIYSQRTSKHTPSATALVEDMARRISR